MIRVYSKHDRTVHETAAFSVALFSFKIVCKTHGFEVRHSDEAIKETLMTKGSFNVCFQGEILAGMSTPV